MAISTNTGDSSAWSSPRLSFSSDLIETDSPEITQREVEVIRLDSALLSDNVVNSDFDFRVSSFTENDEKCCPADELFYNGMIIPTQMKQKLNSINRERNQALDEDEEITVSTTATLIREQKTQSKSIWRFNRSCSLNYDNYGPKKSSIWSLPLLFRSKSTGSSSVNSSNDNSKPNQQKTTSNKFLSNSNSNTKQSCSASHQKPPLKKTGSNGGHNGFSRSYPVNSNGRSGRVLNAPSPYIAKGTSDLLGFGTLFRNGSMDRNKVKK